MSARQDLVTDPVTRAQLLQARHAQAYFSRQVQRLRDDQLDLPSAIPGRNRRWVIADVALDARALACLFSEGELPVFADPEDKVERIAFTATLPDEALRTLSAHAAIHLDVVWRDLPDEAWDVPAERHDGISITPAQSVPMRTRRLWLRALGLNAGAIAADVPWELREIGIDADLDAIPQSA